MQYTAILKYINDKLGLPPRTFGLLDKLTWYKQDKPEWDWEDDAIKHSVLNWHKTFTHGRLTWGRIIQVNTLMFEKGGDNCPGEVLIWCEQAAEFDPKFFMSVTDKLYRMKGNSERIVHSEEKEFAEYLEDQLTRSYGTKVPKRISHGLDLRVSTVFFQRRHIPDGILSDSLFQILYLEDDPMVVVMVPYKFWPKEFLQSFK